MTSPPDTASGPDGPSPNGDPFGDWLAARGPRRPALRVGVSFLALVAGWVAAAATALAPVIGAVCGMVLLLVAVWMMGTPPGRFLSSDPASTSYFLAPAAALGGTCWWIYALWAARAGTVSGTG